MNKEVCPISGETEVEERINHLTHLVGFILSIIGTILLVTYSTLYSNRWMVVSSIIYGTTLVLLYGASTLYHGCKRSERKLLYKIIDHACIYLLIAGTYTPFALGPLRESSGWTLLAIEWGIAVIGITYKIYAVHRFKVLSTLAYLGMGWLVTISWPELQANLSFASIFWLAAGGVFYTFGTIFYLWRSLPWNHAIWHIFVLAGSTSHYISVLAMVEGS